MKQTIEGARCTLRPLVDTTAQIKQKWFDSLARSLNKNNGTCEWFCPKCGNRLWINFLMSTENIEQRTAKWIDDHYPHSTIKTDALA